MYRILVGIIVCCYSSRSENNVLRGILEEG